MMLRPAIAKLFPFLLAIAVFFFGVATDHLFEKLSPNNLFRVADDLVVAVLGCVALFYERCRRRYLDTRLAIIREMNHHVRNALQVISLTTLQQGDEKLSMIRDWVMRIEWALREVLPGERTARRPQPEAVNREASAGSNCGWA